MPDRSKYRRLEDLYVQGVEVDLDEDGTVVMWVQALNPLEHDEARELAATVRERAIVALKEVGSDEQNRALAVFGELPRELAAEQIALMQRPIWTAQVVAGLQDEEEWRQRLEILDRREEIMTKPDDPERELLNKISAEYLEEVGKRIRDEQDSEIDRLLNVSQDALVEEWLEFYRKRHGDQLFYEEFRYIESFYAARCCEAQRSTTGTYDHSECDHTLRVYETKEDFRAAPQEIQDKVFDALNHISMTIRDAKNSDSATDSSDSSALQSKQEESTPSTPTAIRSGAPGT